jgi:hypothetical protein
VSFAVRKDAIQALVFAMRGLDNRCVHYVDLVIPPFLELIRTKNENLVIDLIVQLGFLVSYIKKHIEPYLNNIFKIIEHYWSTNERQVKMIAALIDLVQSLSNVMDIEFKRYLPQILPLILKQLQMEIDDETCTLTNKILGLLRSCTNCLESYIHLILSQFAEYLTIRELRHPSVKKEIMYTIYIFARQITLSDNCAILFQSFIKILEQHSANLPVPPSLNTMLNAPSAQQQKLFQQMQHNQPPILSITHLLFSNSNAGPTSLTNEKLNADSDLGLLTIETLYLLSRQMNGRFFVYAPMFDRVLLKNKSYARLYEQLVINSREATYHTFWPNNNAQIHSNSTHLSSNNNNNNTAGGVGPNNGNVENAVQRPAQMVSFGNLKVCLFFNK